MKLYSTSVSATRWNEESERYEVGVQDTVVLLTAPEDTIEDRLHELARQIFLESERWADHQVGWTEIEQGMRFGNYRLTWGVEQTT